MQTHIVQHGSIATGLRLESGSESGACNGKRLWQQIAPHAGLPGNGAMYYIEEPRPNRAESQTVEPLIGELLSQLGKYVQISI